MQDSEQVERGRKGERSVVGDAIDGRKEISVMSTPLGRGQEVGRVFSG